MRSNPTEIRRRIVPSTIPSSISAAKKDSEDKPKVINKPKETIIPKRNVSKSRKSLYGLLTANIMFFAFLAVVYEYGSGHNHYVPGLRTIFVVMPTLGDHACATTVNELFNNAKYPQNIQIGIYQQNEPEDPDCLDVLQYCYEGAKELFHPKIGNITTLCKMKNNIFINRTTVKAGAKGCHYGRHMTMKLQQKESDFIVFVDSHSVFRKYWDEIAMKIWYTIEPNHEYAVLTHYPVGAENMQTRIDKKDAYSYHICGSQFSGPPNYMLKNSNGCFVGPDVTKPIRVPFWGGGWNFARSHFWGNVPLDPYVQYVFDGDEMNIATRGWTHGYDFYSPPIDIIGHWYGSADDCPKRRNPHVRENEEWTRQKDKSEKRINYMWGLLDFDNVNMSKVDLGELDKYGLGNKRSIEQYWKFAGIDPVTKKNMVWNVSVYLNGGLDYVPY